MSQLDDIDNLDILRPTGHGYGVRVRVGYVAFGDTVTDSGLSSEVSETGLTSIWLEAEAPGQK